MRWLALFTLAACGSGPTCPEALQVCIVTDMQGHCFYAAATCCGTAWTCSQGSLQSAPGVCAADTTITEACP